MTAGVPPIPASCAGRPTVGGVVAPFVNVRLADGGVDFRSPHKARYDECWTKLLCQTCGNRLEHRAVLFGGPNQLASLRFDEPALCPPCALYASQACPMVAGRMARYADRARVSAGRRGKQCSVAGCGCGGWVASDPNRADAAGEPAHDWYAVYVRPGAWRLTGHKTTARCSDKGCEHERTMINGCRLTGPPLKVMLVSTQAGGGGLWRRIESTDIGAARPGGGP